MIMMYFGHNNDAVVLKIFQGSNEQTEGQTRFRGSVPRCVGIAGDGR